MKKKIIKQDINFLEYPNWVIAERGTVRSFQILKDSGRYEITTAADRLPGRLDKIILYYLLSELFSGSNPEKGVVETSRYAVAKGITDNPVNNQIYYQIMRALKRWHGIQIIFAGSFYEGKDEKSTRYFHVIEDVIQEKKSLKVFFNKQFIEQTTNSNYFKNIDFNEYKRLKRPISVRLYEILSKAFAERNAWRIDALKLGEKLTIGEQYPSQIIRRVQPAIKEINKNTELSLAMDCYQNEKDQTIICFKRMKHQLEKDQIKRALDLISDSVTVDEDLIEIINSFTGDWKDLRTAILYSNRESKINYKAFLKGTLTNDWAKRHRAEDEKLELIFSEVIKETLELIDDDDLDREESYESIMEALREFTANGIRTKYISPSQIIKKIEMMNASE
jgi:hypothetical protein